VPEEPGFEVLLLGAVGTLLIFVSGVADFVLAASAASASAPIQFTSDAVTLGVVNMVLTVLLTIFLLVYRVADDAAGLSLVGTLIAIVSAFSLWVGGGFLVGFVLAFTAGVLAVVLANIPEAPQWLTPPLVSSDSSPKSPTTEGLPPAAGAPLPENPEAPPSTGEAGLGRRTIVWICLKCDHENPTSALVCGSCGAPRGAHG